ncbi:hypothetical protein LJC47_07500, partial [Desulfosarcina sp. OttesenSCG-928-B08]|nr:hypothetical protein [Desulfosarcina sp. OttesenSCG-928-B08]
TYVKLVNESDNASGEDPEALYVLEITVPTGTTLDLNGLNVYAKTINTQGTVINGTITPVVGEIPYADLAVTTVTAPAIAAVGGQIELEWHVTNTGNQETDASAWSDKIILSTDGYVGNSDDIVLGTFQHDGTLAAGESYTGRASVTLPAGLDGNFQLFIVTDATNTVYEFFHEHDNASAATPIAIIGSDLTVTAVSPPGNARFGETVDLSWTVQNSGTTPASGTWTDNVYLSSDGTLNGAILLHTETHTTGVLEAGADYTATASIQLPSGESLSAGTYFLVVQTNATGTQQEVSADNNIGTSGAMSITRSGVLYGEDATIVEAGITQDWSDITFDTDLVIRGNVTLTNVTTSHSIVLDGGTLNLVNCTVRNATITQTENGGTATANGGTFDTVTLNTDLTMTGTLHISNGLVLNSTLTIGVGSRLEFNHEQTLSGAGEVVFGNNANLHINSTWNNYQALTVGAGITFHVTGSNGSISRHYGTLVNQGTIIVNAGTGNFAIEVDAFVNEGVISAGSGRSLSINTLTNAAGATVSVVGGGALALNDVQNNGVISIEGSTLTTNGGWTSNGVLSTTDSTINFGGTFRQEDIGAFERTNSTVNLTGTLDNTGETLWVDTAFNGGFILTSGTILGGVLDAVNPEYAMSVTGGWGILDAVRLEVNLSVNGDLHITNGVELNSTLMLSAKSWLKWLNGSQTLSGSGEVVIAGSGVNIYIEGLLYAQTVLTIESGITIRSAAGSANISYVAGSNRTAVLINQGTIVADTGSLSINLNSFVNKGTVSVNNGGSLSINNFTNEAESTVNITGGSRLTISAVQNNGTISAAGSAVTVESITNNGTLSIGSSTLTINGGWPNNGVLAATDSTVNFGGTFRQEDIGTFNRTNSTVYLIGTLDNTGETLWVDTAFNGGFILTSGTILGGVLDAVNPEYAMSVTGGWGILDAVRLEVNLSVNGDLHITNGVELNSTLMLSAKSWLKWLNGSQTLSGSGEVVIAGSGVNIYIEGLLYAQTVLTIESGITIRSAAGSANISYVAGSNRTAVLINQGTIVADTDSLSINLNSFVNEGTISVSNGNSLS